MIRRFKTNIKEKYFGYSGVPTNEPIDVTATDFDSLIRWEQKEYLKKLTPVELLQLSIVNPHLDFWTAMKEKKIEPLALSISESVRVIIKHHEKEFSHWVIVHDPPAAKNYGSFFVELSTTYTHLAKAYSNFQPQQSINMFLNKICQDYYSHSIAGYLNLKYIENPTELVLSLAWKSFRALVVKGNNNEIDSVLLNFVVNTMQIEEELLIKGRVTRGFESFEKCKMKSVHLTDGSWLKPRMLQTLTRCTYFATEQSFMNTDDFMEFVIHWYNSATFIPLKTVWLETTLFDGDVPIEQLEECRASRVTKKFHKVPVGIGDHKVNIVTCEHTAFMITRADEKQAHVFFIPNALIFTVLEPLVEV